MSVRLPFLVTSVVIPSSAASIGDDQRLSQRLEAAASWHSLSAISECSVFTSIVDPVEGITYIRGSLRGRLGERHQAVVATKD
jgi:hypothetical protein